MKQKSTTTKTRETFRCRSVDRKPPTRDPNDILADLRRDWTRLTGLERGERVRELIRLGLSRRRVARELMRSEVTIRKVLPLAELPERVKSRLREGKVSQKEIRRQVAERRREARRRRAAVIGEQEKRRFTEKCGLILATLVDRNLLPAYWEQCFGQFRAFSHGMSQDSSQRPWVSLPSNPRKSLTKCRPPMQKPTYLPELVNYLTDWFVRWSRRVLPDLGMRYEAIRFAESRLRESGANESLAPSTRFRLPLLKRPPQNAAAGF